MSLIDVNEFSQKVLALLTGDYITDLEVSTHQSLLCNSLLEELNIIDIPGKEFFTLLITYYRAFLKSGMEFLSGRFEKALKGYQKLLNDFSSLQTNFANLYAVYRYDIDRLTLRIDGRIYETRASIALANQDLAQAQILLSETINRFSKEFTYEQEYGDFSHYVNTLGNYHLNLGNLTVINAQASQESKQFYEAINNYKKANFLGVRDLTADIKKLKEEVKNLYLTKQESFSEQIFQEGLKSIDNENFSQGKRYFLKASQIYQSLQNIEKKIDWLFQEKLQLSSYYEAKAKDLMIRDENKKASTQFSKASTILNDLLTVLDNEAISQSFQPQIEYFNGMSLFCLAVSEYDNMNPNAQEHLKDSQAVLEQAINLAKHTDNKPLIQNCEESLNKIKSYQEIAKLMFVEEEE